MVRKVLLRDGKKIYWKDGDLHSSDGVVKAADLESDKNEVLSHSGKKFKVYNANFVDQLKKIKRGPATFVMKDLGYFLVHSSVDKNSLVVDAGSGCGVVAATLARYAKKVVSYDRREDHLKIAKKNIEYLGLDNVEFKLGDVTENIEEKDVDVLTLDLPEPWRVSLDCMKNGGSVLVYLPTIVQVQEFCQKTDAYVDKVVELIEREWHVEGKRVRPKSQMIAHTAFLIVCRKV
tara:strand:+ start:412 stop:1110 length:699 start_codon:yes stop_codon:yes gene_type:complete